MLGIYLVGGDRLPLYEPHVLSYELPREFWLQGRRGMKLHSLPLQPMGHRWTGFSISTCTQRSETKHNEALKVVDGTLDFQHALGCVIARDAQQPSASDTSRVRVLPRSCPVPVPWRQASSGRQLGRTPHSSLPSLSSKRQSASRQVSAKGHRAIFRQAFGRPAGGKQAHNVDLQARRPLHSSQPIFIPHHTSEPLPSHSASQKLLVP